MLHIDRREVGAAVAVGGLICLIFLMAWALQPDRDGEPISTSATVVSAQPFVPINKYRRTVMRTNFSMRLDDGRDVWVSAAAGCVPTYNRGDRVRLIATRTNGGRVQWKIVGDRCVI